MRSTFPQAVLKNWRSGATTGKGTTTVALQPYATNIVDVAALQANGTIPPSAQWAYVSVSAPVKPDDLLAVATSFDATGRVGAQTPFSDQVANHWEGGKWEVDANHDTIIAVGNAGTTASKAQITFHFNSGHGKYQVEQTLGPDEQIWLDVGKLIGNQVPDANGKTISSGVMSGTYELQSLSNKPTEGLFEGKLVVDKTYGYAAHGCMVCCGVTGPFLANDPLYVTVGGTTQQDVWATDVCSGTNDLITLYYSSWSTGNTQIATANVNQVSGVAVGSTTNNAYATQIPTGDGAQHRTCPYFHNTQSGPVNVAPTVTIACDTTHLTTGTTNFPNTEEGTCYATLTGGPSGGTYSWTASTGHITLSPNGSTATYNSASESSSQGDTTITVTYTVSGQSGSATSQQITVHKPTSLQTNSTTPNDHTETCTLPCLAHPGDGTCNIQSGTSCSYAEPITRRRYSVVDKWGNLFENVQLSGVTITEQVSASQGTCGGNGVETRSSGGSPFFDDFGKCDSCCESNGPGCTSTATQTLYANGFAVRNESITISCTSATLTP